MKEFGIGEGKLALKNREIVSLEETQGNLSMVHGEGEIKITNEELPEGELKKLTTLIYNNYHLESSLAPQEHHTLHRTLIGARDVFAQGLNNPDTEHIVAGALADVVSDFFPVLDSSLESDLERADDDQQELSEMCIELCLDRLEQEHGPDIFSHSEEYHSYLFILTRISSMFVLGEEVERLKKRRFDYLVKHIAALKEAVYRLIQKNSASTPTHSFPKEGEEYVLYLYKTLLVRDSDTRPAPSVPLVRETLQDVLEHYNQYDTSRIFAFLLSPEHLGAQKGRGLYPEIEYILKTFFERIELDYRTVMTAWQQATADQVREEQDGTTVVGIPNPYAHIVHKNLSQLLALENAEAGMVTTLYRTFGIANFYRYSVDLLLRQYQERDREGPYGIVVSAERDNGVALAHGRDVFDSLSTQLRGHHFLRVVECHSRKDFLQRRLRLIHMYGTPSFTVVNAHGTPSEIVLGYKGRKRESISTGDFQQLITAEGRLFTHNESIVLISCSTGQDGGIAEAASRSTGLTVVAPNKDTAIRDIQVSYDDDVTPHFTVRYEEEIEAVTFDKGKRRKDMNNRA